MSRVERHPRVAAMDESSPTARQQHDKAMRAQSATPATVLSERSLSETSPTAIGTSSEVVGTRDCSPMLPASPPVAIWGGVECTVNRVNDAFFDQFARTGHDTREGDLERIQALGINTLRYPALWERAVSAVGKRPSWRLLDKPFGSLKRLDIRPIVGLLHHGSGPSGTDLLDDSMPREFAEFAGCFARRYPWVRHYNPVNEPLTTARFSALYGHWFPHHRDDRSFVLACLNQYRAISLAMQAIRKVRSDAQLMQTEDLGKTFSSPSLKYQADFENARRWLTFDMLNGNVDAHHPLGDYFRWLGVDDDTLKWFRDHPCPPDTLGINYYVTSERYLDRRVWRYPEDRRGGNGRHRYADVEAVRVRREGLMGIRKLILEAWRRYRCPIAVTEVHLGCGREDQLRWLLEIWREANLARDSGATVQAITVWSLLGAYDWDSLVTLDRGHYEPGAFDIRSGVPRRTALAHLIQQLTGGETPSHPVLGGPGWWRRDDVRLLSKAAPDKGCKQPVPRSSPRSKSAMAHPPILLTTSNDPLGKAFARICELRGLACRTLSQTKFDMTDLASVQSMIQRLRPWAVINTASYGQVDQAEREIEQCTKKNVEGPCALAVACSSAKLPFVTFSSDLVFDGEQRAPYRESDPVNPLGVYGRSNAECERRVLDIHSDSLIVRSGEFFDPWDHFSTVARCYDRLMKRQTCRVHSGVISPTYLPDLVHACLDLVIDRASGIWHLAGAGQVSWTELVEELANRAGVDKRHVRLKAYDGLPAKRPFYRALGSERGVRLPDWCSGLDRYFAEAISPRLT